MNGVERIATERARQINKKGWTPEHDDLHTRGQIATASIAYILKDKDPLFKRERFWPWPDGWKPTPDDRIRELTKAGALIAAEIDRLLRASESVEP